MLRWDIVSGLECPHPPQDEHHLLGPLRALVMFVPHLLYTESLLCAQKVLPTSYHQAREWQTWSRSTSYLPTNSSCDAGDVGGGQKKISPGLSFLIQKIGTNNQFVYYARATEIIKNPGKPEPVCLRQRDPPTTQRTPRGTHGTWTGPWLCQTLLTE